VLIAGRVIRRRLLDELISALTIVSDMAPEKRGESIGIACGDRRRLDRADARRRGGRP
jgi:hypothetical protein